MPAKHSLQLNTALTYERAGLLFRVKLDLSQDRRDDQGAAVSIYAEDLASGARVAFTNEACPALADFVAGYPRWIVRLGIRATAGHDEITGAARPDASITQLFSATEQLCDMIDQKFSLYKERVLV